MDRVVVISTVQGWRHTWQFSYYISIYLYSIINSLLQRIKIVFIRINKWNKIPCNWIHVSPALQEFTFGPYMSQFSWVPVFIMYFILILFSHLHLYLQRDVLPSSFPSNFYMHLFNPCVLYASSISLWFNHSKNIRCSVWIVKIIIMWSYSSVMYSLLEFSGVISVTSLMRFSPLFTVQFACVEMFILIVAMLI
jgi:hypothetical protein